MILKFKKHYKKVLETDHVLEQKIEQCVSKDKDVEKKLKDCLKSM